MEQPCGHEHAVDRFEVDREVGGVGAERAQQVDVEAVGEEGAEEGEDEEPAEVGGAAGLQAGGSARPRDHGEADRAGAEHFPGDDRDRMVAANEDPVSTGNRAARKPARTATERPGR